MAEKEATISASDFHNEFEYIGVLERGDSVKNISELYIKKLEAAAGYPKGANRTPKTKDGINHSEIFYSTNHPALPKKTLMVRSSSLQPEVDHREHASLS
ncbi:hypothetical protein DSL72_002206 [Monilinia vaccinii-corymbosi]|uniref:Uncharacterized protein n=1 Tax=Monilinia vaccinii-corymbosi TaxID=61207 RepID=A0A8A3PC09_9HELO|nr:hypothetical protein DSL72_002206 [Monilinia vaccinii-corymbosi]